MRSKDAPAEAVEEDQQRGDDAREVHNKREKSESKAEVGGFSSCSRKSTKMCVVINFSRAVNGGAGQPGGSWAGC